MANIKSAKKKTRVIKRKTHINRIRIGKYKSAVSEIEKAIKSKDLNKKSMYLSSNGFLKIFNLP